MKKPLIGMVAISLLVSATAFCQVGKMLPADDAKKDMELEAFVNLELSVLLKK